MEDRCQSPCGSRRVVVDRTRCVSPSLNRGRSKRMRRADNVVSAITEITRMNTPGHRAGGLGVAPPPAAVAGTNGSAQSLTERGRKTLPIIDTESVRVIGHSDLGVHITSTGNTRCVLRDGSTSSAYRTGEEAPDVHVHNTHVTAPVCALVCGDRKPATKMDTGKRIVGGSVATDRLDPAVVDFGVLHIMSIEAERIGPEANGTFVLHNAHTLPLSSRSQEKWTSNHATLKVSIWRRRARGMHCSA